VEEQADEAVIKGFDIHTPTVGWGRRPRYVGYCEEVRTAMTGSAKYPRLVGSGRVKGMAQLHQALPLIERQHALIEELRARAPRYVSGADLALRTETTVRTVERDIARLVEAGVPVRVRRGPGGGYRVDARHELPPLTLTPGEAAAIVASLVAVGPYISASAQSALSKLLAALTAIDRG
jgi:biotin operon repressor